MGNIGSRSRTTRPPAVTGEVVLLPFDMPSTEIPSAKGKASRSSRASAEPSVALRAPVRSRVWRNAYTMADGHCYIENNCYCCGVMITFENWHAGHIVAQSKGGSNLPENIRPVCPSCNLSMGAMDMREFVKVCGFYDSRLAREFHIVR